MIHDAIHFIFITFAPKYVQTMKILRFTPILKETLWGGDRIVPFKHIDSVEAQGIGESWEISGIPGHETTVADGIYAGRQLHEVVAELREKLVGQDNYARFGNEFPLLIKFIDARQDLSIQVHPDDEMAIRHGLERGKTEMWYFLESSPGARILTGLKEKLTPEQYTQMVENDTICDAIAEYKVHEGDCFYLPAGRIHSIGAGCFLVEVQQTSDTTYRIYDFKRKDKNGNFRELHTELAAEAIDYTVCDDYQTHYEKKENARVELVKSPYFTVALYTLEDSNNSLSLDYTALGSFVILICVKGEGSITDAEGESQPFNMGDVLLIPATETTFTVSGNVKFLETY